MMKLDQAIASSHPQQIREALKREYNEMVAYLMLAHEPHIFHRAQGRAGLLKELLDAFDRASS